MSMLPRYCRPCGGSIPGNGRHSCEGHKARKRGKIVHEHDGKWWHWDIEWYKRVGPFNSKKEADKALSKSLGIF